MVPENILWAFFSDIDYNRQLLISKATTGASAPKDIYYKDTNGKWVQTTAVFECIEKARLEYRNADAKYLGAVLKDTKTEVERGNLPPNDKKKGDINPELKKRLEARKSNNLPVMGYSKLSNSGYYDKFSWYGEEDYYNNR